MLTTTDGDAVTIVEALKRLGSAAPSKPTFMQAIKRGKIRTITNDAKPNGALIVSWQSVEAYIGKGGFKPRPKPAPAASNVSVPPGVLPANTAEVSGVPLSESSPAKSPDAAGIAGGESPTGKARPKAVHDHSIKNRDPKEIQKPIGSKLKRRPGRSDESGRRKPALRVIKNGLRHLNFEETKAIRDWADNRLLTVLRPTAPVADCQTAAVEPIKQPNI